MSDGDSSDIYVTASRVRVGGSAGGGFASATVLSFSQQPGPDALDPDGTDQIVTTSTFSLINGALVVHLPGYDFPIKVPAVTWERMSSAQ
jgi:hypothetical protein